MKSLLLASLLLPASFCFAQKTVYIPEDLRGMDLQSDTAQWSFRRSVETRDLIFMWERGFGNNLQNPPQLDGHPMSFNLSVLTDRVQRFYTFFRDTLGFVLDGGAQNARQPYELDGGAQNARRPNVLGDDAQNARRPYHSKADRYKMMVMVMYSLDGTAYGGTYDNTIGALWVAPNRIQDTTMNCMAHELGHSFQLQIPADSVGDAWGGTGFFEMTSQWMLWQVNPWWLRDENYHFEAFKKLTHKAFLHLENIYHSPYVIQWWSDLHGRKSIAELYRQGRIGEDPVITYQRLYGLTQHQFCDEMLRGYQHLVDFDFQHAHRETRPYACTWTTELIRAATLPADYRHWLSPKHAPEDYGFNIIPLPLGKGKPRVEVQGSNVRWALVGITADGQRVYGAPQQSTLPRADRLARLFLVVMGAPDRHQPLAMPHDESPRAATPATTYPYRFRVTGIK